MVPLPHLANGWSFHLAPLLKSRHCTSSSENTPSKLEGGHDVGLSSSLPTRLFPPPPPHGSIFLGGGVTQALMETNTGAPPCGAAHPLIAHMISAQLPHPPSQDLPDGSPVAPPSHHPLLAFPTPDVTREQGLHPVCSRGLTSGFHPGWGGGARACPPCWDPLSKGRPRWC